MKVLAERDGLQVVKDEERGYGRLANPRDPATLTRYYESHFWQHEKSDGLVHYRMQEDWWLMTYQDWLRGLDQAKGYQDSEYWLDVGCGFGGFMKALEARGHLVEGIDLSEVAVHQCQMDGLQVSEFGWEDYAILDKRDGISALWLLEHLLEPEAFLEWAAERLVPGGILLLAVPNDLSVDQGAADLKAARKHWWVHPTHINYWNWFTFQRWLEGQGWKEVWRYATWPMEMFITAGVGDYTKDDGTGGRLHQMVRDWDLMVGPDVRTSYYRKLAYQLMGRDIVMAVTRV